MTRFVADSSGDQMDIPGVEIVSVPLTIYNDEVSYTDDKDMDIHEMLDVFSEFKGRSYTSCPSVESWLQAFGEADTIYVVTITSVLSGSYNSAMVARDMYCQSHPQARVHVFDSLTTGPEMRLLMEKLVELDGAGLEFEEVCRQADAYLSRTHLFYALKSLHNLAQNGRVNKVLASAIGMLGISIVATASTKGDIEPIGKCRGEKKVAAKLVEEMEKANFGGKKVRIAHIENPNLAELVSRLIREKYPQVDMLVYRSGGLCSYYAERGGILIGCE